MKNVCVPLDLYLSVRACSLLTLLFVSLLGLSKSLRVLSSSAVSMGRVSNYKGVSV